LMCDFEKCDIINECLAVPINILDIYSI
jgi:hypothetical protein